MSRYFSPRKLARACATHPWITLGAWLLIIVVGAVSARQLELDEAQDIPGSESSRAEHRLEDLRGETPPTETIIVQSATATVDDPAFRSFVEQLERDLRALTGTVHSVTSFYEGGDAGLVSADRRTTILPVVIEGEVAEADATVAPLLKVVDAANRGGFSVMTAGDGSINRDIAEQSEKDLLRGEMLGIPAALVVLLIVFGAAVAAVVPIPLSLFGIVLAIGITAVFSRFVGIGSIAINMITMIGLAVGIDYTLFIVERFREERARGRAKVEAIMAAGDTASRAVLFSGITVIIALAGLLIVPSTTMRGLGIGAIAVVVAAVAIALTLLPAVLSLLGDKVNRLRISVRRKRKRSYEHEGGFFARTTAIVQGHPIIAAVASASLLVVMAVPFTRISLGSPGVSDMPQQLPSVKAFVVLDENFAAGRLAPTHILIDGLANSADVQARVERLRAILANDPAFAELGNLTANEDGSIGEVTLFLNGDATTSSARDAIGRLRNDYVPEAFEGSQTNVLVGGTTALVADYIDTMNTYLPIVISFVLGLSFLLLMMVFRSIVIPLKAIVMNLLSVGASYGLVVLVFQEGVLAGPLGFQESESIAAFLPIFLFGVLFGLSMDYHVFLLSRIQERYYKTGDNTAAVGYGLRSTAHIITGAAAIMIAVFVGFALGDLIEMQQVGFGLAVAVFLDATIVRSVLVPASMQLLGDWNWYFPSWLRWLPEIHVEAGDPEQGAPKTVTPEQAIA